MPGTAKLLVYQSDQRVDPCPHAVEDPQIELGMLRQPGQFIDCSAALRPGSRKLVLARWRDRSHPRAIAVGLFDCHRFRSGQQPRRLALEPLLPSAIEARLSKISQGRIML